MVPVHDPGTLKPVAGCWPELAGMLEGAAMGFWPPLPWLHEPACDVP